MPTRNKAIATPTPAPAHNPEHIRLSPNLSTFASARSEVGIEGGTNTNMCGSIKGLMQTTQQRHEQVAICYRVSQERLPSARTTCNTQPTLEPAESLCKGHLPQPATWRHERLLVNA